eukprot:46699_1
MAAESQPCADALQKASNDLINISRDHNTEEKVAGIIRLLTVTKDLKSKGQGNRIIISRDLLKCLRSMLVDEDKSIRVQACRAMRYITCNIQILNDMVSLNIPIFMMICLERQDNKYLWERMQSLKWIRHLMDHFARAIPKCCIMSLIAIAQNGKDEFRRICLDSLRELCITNPFIINKCNGFKVLIDSILNPQLNDISNSLVLTILYILDHPETRKYLRPNLDIQRLLAPFVHVNPYKTDALTKDETAEREARRDIARKTLMTMLKSITGIFYLAGDGYDKTQRKSCLKILVSLMGLPNNMKGIQWARECIFSVLENALLPLSDSHKLDTQCGPNLIVNYVCLILMAFIKNGLIECLVDVGMRSDLDLAPRARTLLQRIQFLSAKYLPSSLCSRITNLERVMASATMFNRHVLDATGIRRICHCDCHLHERNNSKKKSKFKSNLQITVQRNFANMMISELTEGASIEEIADKGDVDGYNDEMEDDMEEDDALDMDNTNNTNDNKPCYDLYLSSQLICHRLGPEFDLNSTFIRYRYVMDRDIPSTLMFQDRIPYHAHRSGDLHGTMSDKLSDAWTTSFEYLTFKSQRRHILESLKYDQNASYTESVVLSMLKSTQVILTKDFMLWNMNNVWRVLNGPLWNRDNLNIALNKTKFIKRLVQYLKPSRSFFSQLKWSIHTIRHAQCACQLFRLLISSDEGIKNQYFQELIMEIFTHLSDQIKCNLNGTRPGLSHAPFSAGSIRYTLSRTYMVLIGILSENERGIHFFTMHHMLAFLFPLTRKEITDYELSKSRVVGPNDYLLRLIATNLDYSASDDFRMLYPQWMSSGSYYLRKCLITHLELLYRAGMPKFDEWSVNVLAVILKDRQQRLALTALKVLEKINLSISHANSIKSRCYLIDLIATQPTDSMIGIYGQFLFIKMLSTKQGFKFLAKDSGEWINAKRKEWREYFHHRYTNILETALATSTHASMMHNAKDASADAHEWTPYHLLHENPTDEEELYHEYLSQFPWNISIAIVEPSGHEIECATDSFFDYNGFYYRDLSQNPIQIGPGIHGVIDPSATHHIDKNARIRISINIGHGTLDDLYHPQRSLTKTVSMIECKQYKSCAVIKSDQSWFFFEGDDHHLSRVFWSLKEIQKSRSLVRPLPHFYGELAKTDAGCHFVMTNDDFLHDIVHFIMTIHDTLYKPNRDNTTDNNNNLELRSCLWAIGMIGSSKTGLNLLHNHNNWMSQSESINIIDDICILTHKSPTLSIRGTCLYVLGLLSRTTGGMNQLRKYGFDFPADNAELDLGVAIPLDINKFFNLGECDYQQSNYLNEVSISCYSPPSLCRPANMKPLDPNELLGKQGHTEQTVLAHISGLCNNVTYASSRYQLQRLRNKKPSVFTNPLLFRESLKLLNTYQFKLPAKRFVLFTLFDKVIYDYGNAINLFDDSIDAPILPFNQIREWRYNYKQMEIQRKQKKHAEKKRKKEALEKIIQESAENAIQEEQTIKQIAMPMLLTMKQLSTGEAEEVEEEEDDEEVTTEVTIANDLKLPVPGPNDLQKRSISMGYENDLADSPTKQALGQGPNPLSIEH